jgi:hypothetical protein
MARKPLKKSRKPSAGGLGWVRVKKGFTQNFLNNDRK